MKILPLNRDHYPDVKDIHLEGISTGIATFETDPSEWDSWDEYHLPFARLVAIDQDQIIGWAALSPISSRSVYAGIAEISIYVKSTEQGKGIGKALLSGLIRGSEKNSIWTLQSYVISANHSSIGLHHSVGFRTVGVREKLGHYKGQWHDVVLLERRSKKIFYET
jgi:L-amino acid N-acyltransferase YncA